MRPGRASGAGDSPLGHDALSLSLASLRHITPTEFAVTSTLEPALAAVAAAAFLGVTLRPPQYAGGALTIIAVLLLAPTGRDAPLTAVPVGHARGGAARAAYLEARR